MIETWLIEKFGPKAAGLVAMALSALLVVGLAIAAYFAVDRYFTAGLKTQVKVGSAQLDAQAESGHDAVNTVGTVMGNEQVIDKTTRENNDAIEKAPGAAVAVDPGVRAAGLHALCRRASYRDTHPACVQRAAP